MWMAGRASARTTSSTAAAGPPGPAPDGADAAAAARAGWRARSAMVVAVDRHGARRPLLVRYGIDQGINEGDAGALNAGGRRLRGGRRPRLRHLPHRRSPLISRVGEDFLRDLRIRVFDHLQRLSMPFYDRYKAGVLVSRMTSDVDSLAELVQIGLIMFVTNALLLVVSLVVLTTVSWQLMLVCLVALPPVVLASIKFQRDSNDAYLDVRDRIGSTLSHLQEGIAGVRVVQAFAREDVEVDRFERGQPRALRQPHALGGDLGLVPAGHRARRLGHHRPGPRHRRVVGPRGHADASAPWPSSC